MAKFSVWYELPHFYEVEVEAATEAEAERLADGILAGTDYRKFFSSEGEMELHMIENHAERTRTLAGGLGEDMTE